MEPKHYLEPNTACILHSLPVADPGMEPEVLKVLLSFDLKAAMEAALSMGLMYDSHPVSSLLTWFSTSGIRGKYRDAMRPLWPYGDGGDHEKKSGLSQVWCALHV